MYTLRLTEPHESDAIKYFDTLDDARAYISQCKYWRIEDMKLYETPELIDIKKLMMES